MPPSVTRGLCAPRSLLRLSLLGLLVVGCSPASTSSTISGTGGSSGSGGAGGSGGSPSTTGGSGGGGSGGSSTGGSGGSSTGGSGGSSTGGSGGSGTGGSGGSVGKADAAPPKADGSAPAADGGPGAGGNPNNKCFTAMIGNDRSLPGLSPEDFCDGYEKYCGYPPTGMTMSKCAPGQPVGPLYQNRMDCIMKYSMASAGARACRAGQMCRNGKDGLAMGNSPKGMSLIVNACSHAAGYCAGTCK